MEGRTALSRHLTQHRAEIADADRRPRRGPLAQRHLGARRPLPRFRPGAIPRRRQRRCRRRLGSHGARRLHGRHHPRAGDRLDRHRGRARRAARARLLRAARLPRDREDADGRRVPARARRPPRRRPRRRRHHRRRARDAASARRGDLRPLARDRRLVPPPVRSDGPLRIDDRRDRESRRAPRHRQDRDARRDPVQNGSARRERMGGHAEARRSSAPTSSPSSPRSHRTRTSSARTTSAGTAKAIRKASRASRSPSKRASSPSPTRSTP